MQPRQDSNLDQAFRKRLFYPLNYGAPPYQATAKMQSIRSLGHMIRVLLALFTGVALLGCQSPSPDTLPFVKNSQTVERVFRAFEAEDGEAFWAGFAEGAVWRGTGVNAPTTLSRETMKGVYDKFWAEFDYKIVGDLNFLPGVSPETKLPNGSVHGMFLWEVSRVGENGERRAVQLWIYESFDFNEQGQIVFTQVFSDLASAYRQLRESPEAS